MKEIKAKDYSIFVSTTISKDIVRFLKANKKGYSKLFILVDENSLQHCYPQLVSTVPQFESAEIIEIESGEENKTIEVCIQLWEALSEMKADRKALFINLGGGVISDLGGFVAASFKRGIDFINIPTTLLAQVDASIGGKVGVDLNHLKNQIGVFHNPKAVFVNSDFINTLHIRHVLSGFAEIIKHALIADKAYWQLITASDFSDPDYLNSLIATSIHIKNQIVLDDPNEKNTRKMLNFGHTIGHAIETFSLESQSQKHLLHGEAVAIGLICESYLSHKVGKLSKEELAEITQFILTNFKPVVIDKLDAHRLIELMMHDKKNEKGEINFSLISSIGKCEINKKASSDMIIDSLNYYTNEIKHFRNA